MLYDEIRKIFEGFVQASVEAIEPRDPTTSGHSRRVADLTVGLAKAVERADSGPYRAVSCTREDLRELEYASLLHDFGKIGVREQVLVKAKKLYPGELELIRPRFDFVIRTVEAEIFARKLALAQRGGRDDDLAALDQEFASARRSSTTPGTSSSAPTSRPCSPPATSSASKSSGRQTYTRLDGQVETLLTGREVQSLSVMRGSLTPDEFDEIRATCPHVQVPLADPVGQDVPRVALIAGAHHERLNGTGYPNRLRAEEIPLQSKMMSITDIFDALTASDRPYKNAVPVEKALDILRSR